MNTNKNMTREERALHCYSSFGIEFYDTRKPRHHGWSGKSQKKIRRERRQRGNK